jgi:hypothetical protein
MGSPCRRAKAKSCAAYEKAMADARSRAQVIAAETHSVLAGYLQLVLSPGDRRIRLIVATEKLYEHHRDLHSMPRYISCFPILVTP